jgi:Protein of unknown function (DUF2798)
MIPARFAPVLFGLILSGLMSLIVSGLATYRVVGGSAGFLALWMHAWIMAWLVAFPIVLVAAPLTRRLVALATTSR